VGGGVGRTQAQAHQAHIPGAQQFQEFERLPEIHLPRVVGVQAEPVGVGQLRVPTVRLAPAVFFPRPVGVHVGDGDATADDEARTLGADAVDDTLHETRATLEVSAVGTRPRARAQEFVQEVAVAGLHVHEVEARFKGQPGRGDKGLANALEFGVREKRQVRGQALVSFQNGVPGGQFGGRFTERPRKASRMGQLQTHAQIVQFRSHLPMPGMNLREQGGQGGRDVLATGPVKLVGVGAPLRADRKSLAAPDHLGRGTAKAAPTSEGRCAGRTFGGAVPTLHGMNGEAIAQGHGTDVEGLAQGPRTPLQDQVHVQIGKQLAQVGSHDLSTPETARCLELHVLAGVLAQAGETVQF